MNTKCTFFYMFVGRERLLLSRNFTQSSIQNYGSPISLLKAWRLLKGHHMLVAVLLLLEVFVKSFQTSDCFSDAQPFTRKKKKEKPKQNLSSWRIKCVGRLFSWFSSEDIHLLIIYQPTYTWQPASFRSTAFGPCSLERAIQLQSTKASGELCDSSVPGQVQSKTQIKVQNISYQGVVCLLAGKNSPEYSTQFSL